VAGMTRRRRQEGFVLVLALLMVSALCAILVELNFKARAGLYMADNGWRATQALYCAEAGIQTALEILRSDCDIEANTAVKELLSGRRSLEVGDGSVSINVTLESGKLNVNALVSTDGKPVRRQIESFLRMIDLINIRYGEESPVPYGLAPALVDWIDPDDEVTVLPYVSRDSEGAENSYYLGQERHHKCRNDRLVSLDELLLLKGMKPEFLDGRPADPEKGVAAVTGLRPFLTVYGESRVNINYAPPEVIQSLSPRIDSALADAIVATRAETKFSSAGDLLGVPGMSAALLREIEQMIAVGQAGRYYRVTARGQSGGMSRVVEVVFERGGRDQPPRVASRKEM